MLKLIRDFTDGTNFNNAIKATLSAVIPVLVFSNLGSLETGLTIALGALFTLPSDIPSNLNHKIKGITASVLFFSIANLLINLTYPYPIIFVPVFCTMVFTLSMLAVYGQRATMVAFSTLLIISICIFIIIICAPFLLMYTIFAMSRQSNSESKFNA